MLVWDCYWNVQCYKQTDCFCFFFRVLVHIYSGLRKYSLPWHFSYFVALQPGIKMDFLGGLYHLIYKACLPLWRCKIVFIVKQTRNNSKNRTWACITIHPPKIILCRGTFCSNYSCEYLAVCLYKLGTSSHWDVFPFFKAKLLQLLQVGWVPLVYSNL